MNIPASLRERVREYRPKAYFKTVIQLPLFLIACAQGACELLSELASVGSIRDLSGLGRLARSDAAIHGIMSSMDADKHEIGRAHV